MTQTSFALNSLVSALSMGGGLSPETHELLNTLVHDLARTCYLEVTRAGRQVTSITVWESSSKEKKIREFDISRAANKVTQIVRKQFDGDGNLSKTITSVITRMGGAVVSIQDTES